MFIDQSAKGIFVYVGGLTKPTLITPSVYRVLGQVSKLEQPASSGERPGARERTFFDKQRAKTTLKLY